MTICHQHYRNQYSSFTIRRMDYNHDTAGFINRLVCYTDDADAYKNSLLALPSIQSSRGYVNQMPVILHHFWRICLFRAGPEQLPDSGLLAGCLSGLYVVVAGLNILYAQPGIGLPVAILSALATLLIMAGAMQFLVRLKQCPERFMRGFSALTGCNIILLLFTALFSFCESNMGEGVIPDVANLLLIIAVFWWIGISGFILSRTIGVNIILGVGLAGVLEILQIQTINQFFIGS